MIMMILMLHTNIIMIVITIYNYNDFDVAHKMSLIAFTIYENIDFDIENLNDHVRLKSRFLIVQ